MAASLLFSAIAAPHSAFQNRRSYSTSLGWWRHHYCHGPLVRLGYVKPSLPPTVAPLILLRHKAQLRSDRVGLCPRTDYPGSWQRDRRNLHDAVLYVWVASSLVFKVPSHTHSPAVEILALHAPPPSRVQTDSDEARRGQVYAETRRHPNDGGKRPCRIHSGGRGVVALGTGGEEVGCEFYIR
jgi:hypothetical protein